VREGGRLARRDRVATTTGTPPFKRALAISRVVSFTDVLAMPDYVQANTVLGTAFCMHHACAMHAMHAHRMTLEEIRHVGGQGISTLTQQL
jgi:hypothetical protein